MKVIRPFTINDAALISSNILENDYSAYSVGTTYALKDRVIYVTTNVHLIYESLVNSNIGNAVTDTTKWLLVGNTNKWRMFDQSVQSQSSNLSTIVDVFTISDRIDSAVILNANAASARIQMVDAIDGTVYDKTYPLVSYSGITDWYAYFFEPIVRLQDLAITDMPPYVNSTVTVTLTDAGNTVLCGALIFGLQRNIGGTQYGISTGITDYSIKSQDTFGNYTITPRSFRKRSDVSIWMDNTLIDAIQILLASYRATPIVYIGVDGLANTIIYGFYRDFSINIAYVDKSICTMQLEGLT